MASIPPPVALKRSLGLTLLTLYGLGVMVGAGIYVLVGEVAAAAGALAPFAFVLAAVLTAFSALSYAELSTRYPVSAGEAVYVAEGLRQRWLASLVGLMIIAAGIVSSAVLARGLVGYTATFIVLPSAPVIIAIVTLLTLLAVWGIAESVLVAAIATVVEVAALVFIVVVAADDIAPGFAAMGHALGEAVRAPSPDLAAGMITAMILAFFAFIGFEDMVNVAEEVHEPGRTLPRAILLTLVITTVLYVLVSLVVVASPVAVAGGAPLALIADRALESSGAFIALVAIFAVINGGLIQIVMASRVLYGMANQGWMPAWLGVVNARTRTPVAATVLVGGVVLVAALALPVAALAQATSFILLLVYALVNLSLLRLRRRRGAAAAPRARFTVPLVVPVLGCVGSASLALALVLLHLV